MPATVPSDCPKKGANGSPREKVGPNSKTGGMGSGATPLNPQKGGRLEKWVQDVSETHDTTRHDDGSSTSGASAGGAKGILMGLQSQLSSAGAMETTSSVQGQEQYSPTTSRVASSSAAAPVGRGLCCCGGLC